MIITGILTLLYNLITLILTPIGALADVSLDSNIATSLTTAGGYLHSLDNFLPIGTMFAILGISLAFEFAYLTFKVIMWVLAKIPTIN